MYVHKKCNINGKPVCWNKLRWMKYTSDNVGQVLYKHSFSNNEQECFKILDLNKKTRGSCELIGLKPLHSKPLPLSKEKLKDLNLLLFYINETSWPFYNALMQNVQPTSGKNNEENFSD